MFTIYRTLPKPTNLKLNIIDNNKTLLKYGLPVSIGAILSGFLTQFYSYILAIYVSNNATIGNYAVAVNFVVLITFFATPVTTMLFPAFSKLDPQKDKALFGNIFQYSVKYASIYCCPSRSYGYGSCSTSHSCHISQMICTSAFVFGYCCQ